jgi:hypothetical protein
MQYQQSIKPIETHYRGYRFRSRLEARWAVFFDKLGLKYEYEPEGFQLSAGWYLPDFCVHYPGDGSVWFEVKPKLTAVSEQDWARIVEFEQKIGGLTLVLDGAPDLRMYQTPAQICNGDLDLIEPAPLPLRAQKHSFNHKRFGYALYSHKQRPWWDEHINFFDEGGPYPGVEDLKSAVVAARSARFEHGEKGARA